MEYNFLAPNCGLKVSAICLGAMTFQKTKTDYVLSSLNIDQEASFKILDRFVELGGNFIDTADVYSEGQSEEVIGEWMKRRGNRKDMIIATKVRFNKYNLFQMDPRRPNAYGLSRKHILDAVEGSLKRLQTDYIDLYQIHGPDFGTPSAEVVRTLDDLVRAGKVRYVGACNLLGWQLQKFVDLGKELNCNPWVTMQSMYNLLGRYYEPDTFLVCRNEGLGLIPHSVLASGLLTGKFKKGDKKAPKGSRMEFLNQQKTMGDLVPTVDSVLHDEKYWALRDGMERIGRNRGGKSVAQVALRWLLQTPPVTSVIIGATKVHQLEDNMGVVGWRLTEDEMAELNKLSERKLPYEYALASFIQDGRVKEPGNA